jgi:hypothetical protein
MKKYFAVEASAYPNRNASVLGGKKTRGRGEGGVTAQPAVENVAHDYLTALVNLITRPQFSLTLNIQSGSALARRSALRRVLPLRKHSHETEHLIIDKMGTDSTDHEIGTRLRKMHYFNTVLREESRIQSPVYSVFRVVDQPWWN